MVPLGGLSMIYKLRIVRMLRLAAIMLLAVMVVSFGALAEPPIHECDRLAAHPDDPHKVGAGVKWGAIDVPRAIRACKRAVQMFPDVPRFQVQYGRALEDGKQYQESLKWYRLSAKQKYAAAQYSIGSRYERGLGVAYNMAKAVKWWRLAAER
jgi:predicted Zn-dependent protease